MNRIDPGADVIAALNIKLSSISSSETSKLGGANRSATAPGNLREKSVDALPDNCPEVDLTKIPASAPERKADCLIVEQNGWPGYLLFEQGSWALHGANLDKHGCKPGIRVILAKAETHGPKTTPYTVYILHIKTAFTVRGLSRRYSEFKVGSSLNFLHAETTVFQF